MMEVIN